MIMAEKEKEKNPEGHAYFEQLTADILRRTPLGRIGEPEDIANMVLFLASERASWITGQTFSVNGGMLMP
jgi:3-oxoacyl-[acyl-carrier protein] reductase